MPVDPLVGEHVALVPVGPAHYEMLRIAEAGRLGQWWRNRGELESPEEFTRRIWHNVSMQVLAVGKEDGKVLSWLQCYGVSHAAGTGSLSLARLDEGLTSLRNAGATAKFIDHCFTGLGLRKLYVETAEQNFAAFASMRGELLVEEGRLVDHVYFDGERHDMLILALWRDTWESWPWRNLYLSHW